MKLNKFIKQLKEIEKKHDDKLEIIMADGCPVIRIAYLKKFHKPSIVITDQ